MRETEREGEDEMEEEVGEGWKEGSLKKLANDLQAF